jgi:hypothetical protein
MGSRTFLYWCLAAATFSLTLRAHSTRAQCVDYSTFPNVVATLNGEAGNFETLGSDCFVALDYQDLVVISLTDPSAPQRVAIPIPTGSWLTDLAVCGTTAYCLDLFGQVYAVDPLDPLHHFALGTVDLGGEIRALSGDGDLLAAVGAGNDWRLFRIVDPLAPTLLYQSHCEFTVSGVELTDDLAILRGTGWKAYLLTDPATPEPIGGEAFSHVDPTVCTYGYGTEVLACKARDGKLVMELDEWEGPNGNWPLYIVYQHNLSLRTLDVLLSGNLEPAATVSLGTVYISSWGVYDDQYFPSPSLVLDHGLVYAHRSELGTGSGSAGDFNAGGIGIYDGDADLATLTTIPAGRTWSFVARDEYVYATTAGRMTTYKVLRPPVDNTWPMSLPAFHWYLSNWGAAAGDGWIAVHTLMDTGEGWWGPIEDRLRIYDLAYSNVGPVRGFNCDHCYFGPVFGGGDRLFVSGDPLRWVDMTDPRYPSNLQSIPINNVRAGAAGPSGLVAVYCYTSVNPQQLRIYDLTDPGSPVLLGSVDFSGGNIIWQGDLVLVIGGESLQVIDVQDPASPVLRSTLAIGVTTWSHAAGGARVLVGNGNLVQMIDCSDPAAPQITASMDLLSGITDAAVVGDFVYVANGGIWALQFPTLEVVGALAPEREMVSVFSVAGELYGVPASADGTAALPLDCTTMAAVEDPAGLLPATVQWIDASPNPFNPRAEISFTTPAAGHAVLSVFDLHGRVVRRLVEGAVSAGVQHVDWDGRDDDGRALPSGVYLVRLTKDGQVSTAKVMLMK